MEAALQDLKHSILHMCLPDLHFIMPTGASQVGLEAVLTQEVPKEEHLIFLSYPEVVYG